MRAIQLHYKNQTGIALIMVLLVVAMASILTVSMASRQRIDIRRTVNVLDHEQAYLYLLAAESYAVRTLNLDYEDDKKNNSIKDSLDEAWAIELSPAPVEGGNFVGKIVDLQGRFNINNLYQGASIAANDYAQFKRLLGDVIASNASLSKLNINTDIADAIVDWIDNNLDMQSDTGGEDNLYLNRVPSYRTANHYISSPSELMVLNGFNKEIYASIKDYITALPFATKINVNTASELLLKSLSPNLSDTDVKEIISKRGDKGFDSIDEFLGLDVTKGKQINKDILSVSSDYFMVQSIANVGIAHAYMYSIVHRDTGGKTRVLLRTQREI